MDILPNRSVTLFLSYKVTYVWKVHHLTILVIQDNIRYVRVICRISCYSIKSARYSKI